MSAEVEAAGGVVRDRTAGWLLVHRPRYDDWTLPKGKLDPGESFEEAALREVEEETGLRCRLVRELPASEYRDNKGRPKLVRYWLMEVEDDPGFVPNDEVDELRWLDPGRGRGRCSPTSATATVLAAPLEPASGSGRGERGPALGPGLRRLELRGQREQRGLVGGRARQLHRQRAGRRRRGTAAARSPAGR